MIRAEFPILSNNEQTGTIIEETVTAIKRT